MATAPLSMGMVGGGRDAFIGGVHRSAALMDGRIAFVAGALSSTPEKSLASGRDLGLADDRNYPSWQAMIKGELARGDDAIDFVTIVTPNHTHFEIALGFVEAGFNVVLDKPMCMTVDEANRLVDAVETAGVLLCVTYNYTGYPMVKEARHLVASGAIGDVRKVIVEYHQGWLAEALEETGQKQASWRTNPALAGAGGAIGDIGSHAENLLRYVTGTEIEGLCADLTSFISGRALDDDASVLLRLEGGGRGILTTSQVCVGQHNDLRLRVWGTAGGLTWHQEDPNTLTVTHADGPDQVYHRGAAGLCDAAVAATRLPAGHPEAFIEAFGNLYAAVTEAILNGETTGDFPTAVDGAAGVAFIHACVTSSEKGHAWCGV
jgi:predicted dehydrogenase